MVGDATRKHDRVMLGCLALVVGAPLLALAFTVLTAGGRMTSAGSPDGRYVITLDEQARSIDRSFRILLLDVGADHESTLDWPGHDQSPLIRREHFVWSADSRYVALVGDRYFALPEASLPTGDQVLLVYDTATNTLHSNYDMEPNQPFSAEKAVGVFGESILEPAPKIE